MSYLTFEEKMRMSLDDIIHCYNREEINYEHDQMFNNIPFDYMTNDNYELLNIMNYNVALYDWQFVNRSFVNSYGKEQKTYRVVGYLPNENRWETSDIVKLTFSFNEVYGYYLLAETWSRHYYILPLVYSRYDDEYLNVYNSLIYGADIKYHPTQDKIIPEEKRFTMEDWKIVNCGGGYYLFGDKYSNDNEFIGYQDRTTFNMRIASFIFRNEYGKLCLEVRTIYGDVYTMYYDDSRVVNQKIIF